MNEIKKFRLAAGYTQDALARELGCFSNTLSLHENNRRTFPVHFLPIIFRLADEKNIKFNTEKFIIENEKLKKRGSKCDID